ncbi:MAG TPA: DUF1152 domain-containing protein [Kofleriaceae bacterium]|nr:DUF1152 domain-containing protein [Kofleriaceae bacterium]
MLETRLDRYLGHARRVLLAGCGGGYDVLGAIPLAHQLRARGVAVELASFSFSYLNALEAPRDEQHPNLYAVGAGAATEHAYCPEAWLARWLDEELGGEHVVWSFEKTGVRPLERAYRALVERLAIDAIILVDGGVDAVLRGDETSLGTPAEDLTSLAAVTGVPDVPIVLACVGLSAELRDGIAHAQFFERIAELTRLDAYLGASAMVPGTAASDAYVRGVQYVFAGQMHQKRSHVHSVVTRSLSGEFGPKAPHVWLSPLASMYWYFDARMVAGTHVFLDDLRGTEGIWDVAQRIAAVRARMDIRGHSAIPL